MHDSAHVSNGSGWTILCDFDGTITLEDVIDTLLERFGRAGWQALERDWREGRIGSRECMHGQVALLRMSSAELEAHLDETRIDPDFADFVAMARAAGVPLRVVSDGLDHAIHHILRRHGLSNIPVTANHLRQVAATRWALSSPFSAGNCGGGTCKCACAHCAGAGGRRTLLIGDGASDFCAAGEVDFVFAKHALIAHCKDRHIPHRAIGGFGDARILLPRLLAGEFDPAMATSPPTTQSRPQNGLPR